MPACPLLRGLAAALGRSRHCFAWKSDGSAAGSLREPPVVDTMRNILQDMEQRFDELRRDFLGRGLEPYYGAPLLGSGMTTTPACDVCDMGNEYVVTLDMPGFDKKDIRVDVEDHGVRVWATTTRETTGTKTKETPTWLRRERMSQSYERFVTFPEEIGADGTRAAYKNGVLEIALPKTTPERRRSKAIEVQ